MTARFATGRGGGRGPGQAPPPLTRAPQNWCASVDSFIAVVDEVADTVVDTRSKYPVPTSRWCLRQLEESRFRVCCCVGTMHQSMDKAAHQAVRSWQQAAKFSRSGTCTLPSGPSVITVEAPAEREQSQVCWPCDDMFNAYELTLPCPVSCRLVGGVPVRQAGLAGVDTVQLLQVSQFIAGRRPYTSNTM